MIDRTATATLKQLATWYPAVALTGPRQAGKTTLAQAVFPGKPYRSLEDPDQREFALSDPRGFLAQFPDGAILDEVQRSPELFSYLQTRLDAGRRMGLFILTGSQQFSLNQSISQSLAGRVGYLHLLPFTHEEMLAGFAPKNLEAMLLQGFYPPLFDRGIPPHIWYADYVATYIERDLRQLINVRDLATFQRFLRMCAARTGQMLNLSALAADCGITHNTAKSWVSILQASYLVVLLPPWHRNLGKRLVKTPKLYFLDTGLAAWLAGVRKAGDLELGSMRGALFETWVVSEFTKYLCNHALPNRLYFWRDSAGNEVDLLVEHGPETAFPIECKAGRTVAADWFKPLQDFCKAAGTSGSALIYGGQENQPRSQTPVFGWESMQELVEIAFRPERKGVTK
ncbi:MAG: ATP-binding protein [Gallionella sp.]|nr:ATP-binding protein [Gallionella sp.]